MIIPRGEYIPERDLAEGDLVAVHWEGGFFDDDTGIVLKVALDVRNEDHLCPSKEVLIAEVLVDGSIYVFDEDELTIIEKCINHTLCV